MQQWFRTNAVGLLMALVVLGGSYGTLYGDVRVNSGANDRQDDELQELESRMLAESTTLQSTIIRLTSLEGQAAMLADTTRRTLIALDKIDVMYRNVITTDAIQDEQIKSLVYRIEREESKIK